MSRKKNAWPGRTASASRISGRATSAACSSSAREATPLGQDRSRHQRQMHLELGAAQGGALHRDVAAVLAHDAEHDREPETGAAPAPGTERLEDATLRLA